MADAAGVFRVLDAAVPDERREWVALWDRWPAREVFAHPSYVELDASADTTHVRAATYVSPDGIVLYPFLQRALPADVHCGTEQDDAASDITAPYGYGGPQCWAVGNRAQLADEFWAAFDAWAAREKIVSEFIRFSLFADTRLPYVSEMVEVQSNVVRDLELSMDQLWMMFEH
ncbi:MAG: hypothetical protein ABJE47_06345, partial [bacterium]